MLLPKTRKILFIFRLPNFQRKLQNPAYFYEFFSRILKGITAADKILAWKILYESSKIFQKVFANI